MSRHWTDEERETFAQQCLALHVQGWSQNEIARHLRISQTSVWRLLPHTPRGERLPPPLPPPGPRITIDLAEVFDEVIAPRLYAAGCPWPNRRASGSN